MKITFTAQSMDCYMGFDGGTLLRFPTPGTYEVSQEKAEQLLRDFPLDFQIIEDTAEEPEEKPSRKRK
jgi:hypothetical protein